MEDTSLVRVDMETCPLETVDQWAACYCEIWREPPWNENFWRPEEVIKDFRDLMRKPDASAFLALQKGTVAGFTLGYSVDCEELRVIAGNSLMDPLFEKFSRIFYIDELGVAAQFRGQRISSTLTSTLIQAARTCGIKAIVLRTHTQAHVARHVYEKLGFIELDVHDAKYPDRTYWLLGVS